MAPYSFTLKTVLWFFESQEIKYNGQFQTYFRTQLGYRMVSEFFIPICLSLLSCLYMEILEADKKYFY